MLNVYFQNGGQELQINVVDSAALRAAQKNPEQYRDLVVRIAGFSEFFVNLTPEMQEEIIARTEPTQRGRNTDDQADPNPPPGKTEQCRTTISLKTHSVKFIRIIP